ncbi:MAG: DUF4384 domain-containing protein [Gemmatimonadetes bacterium]|nr:DUF4384 domain-containing protein [Gemmatimonadota bacterium]
MLARLLLTSLLLAALTTDGRAGPPPQDAEAPVRIRLSRDQDLRQGDRVRVYLRTAADGYAVILHAEPDGRIRVLFPVDPYQDHFVRGYEDLEIRSRGDREALVIRAARGDGTVYAGFSRDPFRLEEFASGDHWDYRLLDTWIIERGEDIEAELTALVEQMAAGSRFDYDLVRYRVGDRVTHSGWYGPRLHTGIYYDPFYADDPFYSPGFTFSIGLGLNIGGPVYPYYPLYGRPYYGHRYRYVGDCYYDPYYCDPFFGGYGYYDRYWRSWYDPFGLDPFWHHRAFVYPSLWVSAVSYRYYPTRVIAIGDRYRYGWAAVPRVPSPLYAYKEQPAWGDGFGPALLPALQRRPPVMVLAGQSTATSATARTAAPRRGDGPAVVSAPSSARRPPRQDLEMRSPAVRAEGDRASAAPARGEPEERAGRTPPPVDLGVIRGSSRTQPQPTTSEPAARGRPAGDADAPQTRRAAPTIRTREPSRAAPSTRAVSPSTDTRSSPVAERSRMPSVRSGPTSARVNTPSQSSPPSARSARPSLEPRSARPATPSVRSAPSRRASPAVRSSPSGYESARARLNAPSARSAPRSVPAAVPSSRGGSREMRAVMPSVRSSAPAARPPSADSRPSRAAVPRASAPAVRSSGGAPRASVPVIRGDPPAMRGSAPAVRAGGPAVARRGPES